MDSSASDLPETKSKALKEHLKAPWLKAFSRIGTIAGTCEHIGIDRTTYYRWKQKDPAFAELFSHSENTLTENLESVAMEKALRGDPTMLIFMLKSRAPQKYTERYRHEIENVQFNRLIGLLTSVIKRVVPKQLWPQLATEIGNVASGLESGESTNTAHLLQ